MNRDALMDYRGSSWFLGNIAHRCMNCGKITDEKLEICCNPLAKKEPYQLSGFGKIISYTTTDKNNLSIFPSITVKTDEGIIERDAAWVGIKEPEIGTPAEIRVRMTRFDRRPIYNTPTRPYSEPLFDKNKVYAREDFSGDEVVINGWGTYIGFYAIPTKEIGRSDVVEKRIAHSTEDAVTILCEAARYAVLRSGFGFKGPGTIRLGTEYRFTDSQPYANLIGKKVNTPNTFDSADVSAACFSGFDAILDGYRAIKSGDSDWAIAAGGDIAAYLGRNDADLKNFTADGGTAYRLGKGNKKNSSAVFLKTKDGRISCRFADCIYDYDVDKLGNAFHSRRFTGEPAYFNVGNEVGKQFKEQFDLSLDDIKYAVFHDPNLSFPMELGTSIGFSEEQLEPNRVVTPRVGNVYGGMIPFNWALEHAQPEDLIVVDKYGSGADGGIFVLKKGYADNIAAAPTVDELINHKMLINRLQYEEIMRMREKILGFA